MLGADADLFISLDTLEECSHPMWFMTLAKGCLDDCMTNHLEYN